LLKGKGKVKVKGKGKGKGKGKVTPKQPYVGLRGPAS
jgi:hypothetical protein